MSRKGKIHSIETFSTVDGPGIRLVVFLQGCFLECIYCHNPDSWNFKAGKEKTALEVFEKIKEYAAYIKNGGITISGGEPFLQPEFCLELLNLCKKEKIHTAIETAASTPLEVSKEVINNLNLLILDLKAAEKDAAKKICKIDIKNPVETLKYCEKIKKDVWVRHVLLSGFTLKEEELNKTAEFLKEFSCIKRVELLPFHKMGEFKWQELKIPYSLKEVEPPTDEEINTAVKIFKNHKINVIV